MREKLTVDKIGCALTSSGVQTSTSGVSGLRCFLIECFYHCVPRRDQPLELIPECLVSSTLKILYVDALLFDPGVVPEVEYPISIDFGEFQQMVDPHIFQVCAIEFG
ncbi:uncharacterized protein METZ01_LOCUS53032, partial [marine metagenome]